MKVIRNGVFETNSSSTHSICISDKRDITDTLAVNSEGVCKVQTGEFGWGYETYNDAAGKASYCATHIVNNNVPERKAMFEKVVKEVTGAKTVELASDGDGWNPSGYIDHQSCEVIDDAFVSEEALKNFIFNLGSELVIDNDNH